MPRAAKNTSPLTLPDVKPGNWRGEILGNCTVSFGQVVQDGPPRHSVEFTYMVMPAILTMPEPKFTWPGIVMIMAPTSMKTDFPDAGHLTKAECIPSMSLSLQVTREQFSDMFRLVDVGRLRDFHFTVEEGADGSWPIYSWGMSVRIEGQKK